MAIVEPKFPIYRAAKLAGEAEDKAKEHTTKNGSTKTEKNSLCIFDTALHWDVEFPFVKALKDTILNLLQDHGLPSSYLTKMATYSEMRKSTNKQDTYRWLYLMAYDTTRNASNLKEEAKQFVKQQQEYCVNKRKNFTINNTYTTDYHYLDLLALACRWAELEKRTKEKKA